MSNECDHLVGRVREICLGEANLPLDMINAYRASDAFGNLPPLSSSSYHHNNTTRTTDRSAPPFARRLIRVSPEYWRQTGRPGYHLHSLLKSLGHDYVAGCGCEDIVRWMNDIGVDACRTEENRRKILDKLIDESSSLSPWQKIRTAILSVPVGLTFKLTPEGLLDEALRLADLEVAKNKMVSQERLDAERNKRMTAAEVVKTVMGDKMPENQAVWSYGVTTTPFRRDTLLPRTLASLAAAGFDDPLLGVDKCDDLRAYDRFGLKAVTCRTCHGDNFANWLLTAIEVYLRNPFATHYAIFEDDIVLSKGAKEFLSATCNSDQEYYNLFSAPENEGRVNKGYTGWYISDQFGRGALGLVFRRNTFLTLLSTPGVLHHATNTQITRPGTTKPRGKEYVDGLIVAAMRNAGVLEMCHSPSIAQHMGDDNASGHGHFPGSRTFRGEAFDMREMIKKE